MAALAAIDKRLVVSSVPNMTPSEAAPTAANKVKRGVEAGQTAGRLRPGLRRLGRQCAVADLIYHRLNGEYPAMSTPSGLAGTFVRRARPRERR
jgi:hypothetical protein